MAYNTPPTKSVGNPFTASEWNTYIRDNFAAGFPDLAAAKGDILVATAANAAQALTVGANYQILEALSTETTGLRWTGNPPAAQLLRSTAFSVADNSDVQVTGFSSVFDYTGFISGDTFVIPAGMGGVYLVTASGYFTGHATADKIRQIGVAQGATTRWQTSTQDADVSAIYLERANLVLLTAGEVMRMRALQRSGGALDLYQSLFTIVKLR
jgi:uncharacterized protein YjlB